MVIPPHTLSKKILDEVRSATFALAKELRVVGLMNVQYAIKDGELFLIEVNPRASRTIPFISKVIGVPLAKLAARVMAGEKLVDLGFTKEVMPDYIAVKESVFPFVRFLGSQIMLTPEMRSTGEVMGLDDNLGMAFAKSQMAAGSALPTSGNVFISLKDHDKAAGAEIAARLVEFGFKLFSTSGTAAYLRERNIPVTTLFKLSEGARPNVVDMLKNKQIQIVINTPSGMNPRIDENKIRESALLSGTCMITTIMGAYAALKGIEAVKHNKITVKSLQEYKIDMDAKRKRVQG